MEIHEKQRQQMHVKHVQHDIIVDDERINVHVRMDILVQHEHERIRVVIYMCHDENIFELNIEQHYQRVQHEHGRQIKKYTMVRRVLVKLVEHDIILMHDLRIVII